MRGANWLVGAAFALERSRLRRKRAGTNFSSDSPDDFLRFVELFQIARGFLALVVLQIVENEAQGIQLENFFCSQRIDAELNIFFGVGRLLRLAGLVVDDLDVFFTAACGIDLVHAAGEDDVIFEREFETFFQFENVRRISQNGMMKRAELIEAVVFVTFFLIVVLEAGGFLFGFVQPRQVITGKAHSFAQLIHKAAHGVVHNRAESERGAGALP